MKKAENTIAVITKNFLVKSKNIVVRMWWWMVIEVKNTTDLERYDDWL